MDRYVQVLALAGAMAVVCVMGAAQGLPDAPGETEPVAIVEVGAAVSWTVTGGAATFAPDLAVEWTPIEHWLEIEVGVNPFVTRRSTEWDLDLLLKKPWTLSRTVEFMAGAGPEWVRVQRGGRTTNTVAAEAAGDWMFWPGRRHRVGWFLEPSYERVFGLGHEQALGMEAGVLFGIP